MMHVIWSLIVGVVVGLVARFVLPGADAMPLYLTCLLGVAGSYLGGLLARLIKKPEPGSTFHPAGFLLSVVGAVVLLLLWRLIR